MKPEFQDLMQIGMIVRNVDEAVKHYEEMGIGPWEISCINNEQPPFQDLKFDGKELSVKGDIIKTAMLQRYGLEMELIEPIADTVYKTWLDEHGPGLHHLAFSTDENYEQLLETYKENTGKEPWIRGQAIRGVMDFSYLDYREELGVIVECYKKTQPGKPMLAYETEGRKAGDEN